MTKLLFISLLLCSTTMRAPADPADMSKTFQKNIALLRKQSQNNLASNNLTSLVAVRQKKPAELFRQILSAVQNDGRP